VKKLFERFIKNKNIVTIIAFAVCLVILIVAYNYRIKQKTNPVTVYYAKEDIDAREQITAEMIGTIKIPSSMVTSNVVRSYDNIIDKYVNYNTIIPAGSLFYSSVLVEWSSMPDSAWSNIESGNTIVSLNVNAATTFGNSIYPGDKIDLYYKTVDSTGKLVLGKLIEGIEVLAVKDEGGAHIFKKGPDQRQATSLIFSVSEEMHLLLRKAMYLDGDIVPVPRNANYGETATISSSYLQTLILAQTVDIPTDEELQQAQEDQEANGDNSNITVEDNTTTNGNNDNTQATDN
jgi:sulfur transfer complex TusBCD TusB component (DsrH family)